ncbi:MAG: Rpn family recombination-promoting nuclease/putative transposase, partial [Peptococcaceae bacterium]|nr:Rpn family recombination-promoting nuclease/putative transposase [Peptococcaceae bacterium]
MDFNYDDYYRPCHDVVFAIMLADKSLFTRLCSAVYGKPVSIVGEPLSQAVARESDVLLNSIRFDVLAVADENRIFTLDIQRRYTQGRQERRGVYYMCRSVSTQKVANMKYEELHPVHIAFILTDHPDTPSGVRKVGLCYLDTGDIYDDLIELVLVYVRTVVKAPPQKGAPEDNDLYIFTRFFAVSSEDEAAAYATEFE